MMLLAADLRGHASQSLAVVVATGKRFSSAIIAQCEQLAARVTVTTVTTFLSCVKTDCKMDISDYILRQ